MCFNLAEPIGFLARSIAPLLSSYTITFDSYTPRRMNLSFCQANDASFIVSVIAIYSASVLGNGIVFCVLESHMMGPTQNIGTDLEVDRLSSLCGAKKESANVCSLSGASLQRVIPSSVAAFKGESS